MITIVFISWVIVPVVTVVILDDGVYANPQISVLTLLLQLAFDTICKSAARIFILRWNM